MKSFLILSLVLLITGAACAVDESPGTITLRLDDTDIVDALTQFSRQAGVTILGDASVRGRVNCNLSDVTVEQALTTICRMNNLVWVKAYARTDTEERLRASTLFNLLDSLTELGGLTLMWQDPQTESQTVFIPGAKEDAVSTASLAAQLNLRPIYLIRAQPVPVTEEATPEVASGLVTPPQDPRLAADQVWNYFGQMPMEQQVEVMREIGRNFMENSTPEQRELLRQMFQSRRDRGSRDIPQQWQGGMPPWPGAPH